MGLCKKNNRSGCFWDNLSVAGRSTCFTFFKTGVYLKVTYMEKIFLIFLESRVNHVIVERPKGIAEAKIHIGIKGSSQLALSQQYIFQGSVTSR